MFLETGLQLIFVAAVTHTHTQKKIGVVAAASEALSMSPSQSCSVWGVLSEDKPLGSEYLECRKFKSGISSDGVSWSICRFSHTEETQHLLHRICQTRSQEYETYKHVPHNLCYPSPVASTQEPRLLRRGERKLERAPGTLLSAGFCSWVSLSCEAWIFKLDKSFECSEDVSVSHHRCVWIPAALWRRMRQKLVAKDENTVEPKKDC